MTTFRPLISENTRSTDLQIGLLEVEADRRPGIRATARRPGADRRPSPPERRPPWSRDSGCCRPPAEPSGACAGADKPRAAIGSTAGTSMRAPSCSSWRDAGGITNGAPLSAARSKSTTIVFRSLRTWCASGRAREMRTRDAGDPIDSAASTVTPAIGLFGSSLASFATGSAPTLRKSSTNVSASGRVAT